MNNTIQSLQELYIKLGGSLTDTYDTIASGIPVSDYTIIPDMIEALSQVASSGLPEVTDEDNGKILGVVNGQWDKEPLNIEIPAQVNTFIFQRLDTEDDFTNIYGYAFSDIVAAVLSDIPVIVQLNIINSGSSTGEMLQVWQCSQFIFYNTGSSDRVKIVATMIEPGSSSSSLIGLFTITITSDGEDGIQIELTNS